MISLILTTAFKSEFSLPMVKLLLESQSLSDKKIEIIVINLSNDPKLEEPLRNLSKNIRVISASGNLSKNQISNLAFSSAKHFKVCFFSDEILFNPLSVIDFMSKMTKDEGMAGLDLSNSFSSINSKNDELKFKAIENLPDGYDKILIMNKPEYYALPEGMKNYYGLRVQHFAVTRGLKKASGLIDGFKFLILPEHTIHTDPSKDIETTTYQECIEKLTIKYRLNMI